MDLIGFSPVAARLPTHQSVQGDKKLLPEAVCLGIDLCATQLKRMTNNVLLFQKERQPIQKALSWQFPVQYYSAEVSMLTEVACTRKTVHNFLKRASRHLDVRTTCE